MPTELLTRDEQTAMPPASPAPPAVTPPGLLGRLRDSCWIAWTFTLLFDWVAFFWIGFRARNRRWIAWGVLYALPFVVVTAAPIESLVSDVAIAVSFGLGFVSIVHAFAIRRTYIAQRRALTSRLKLAPVTPLPTELGISPPADEAPAPPAEPHVPGLGGLIHRGLEAIVDPCHVEWARALLEEGRRQEALAVLEQGLPAARKSIERDWYYSGEREHDLALAEPALEELAEVRTLAREVLDGARWGSWDDDLVAGFENLAAAAEREAKEVRAAALARSGARCQRDERRRFKKAMALCLAMPLLLVFCVGFSASEEAPPDPSTVELVVGFIVIPVLFALLSAAATWRLGRRKVTSNVLYAPFWVGFIAAGVAACLAIY